jgi:hypothetical protein
MKDYAAVIESVAYEIFLASYDQVMRPPQELLDAWWQGGRSVGSHQYEASIRQARAAIAVLAASGLMQGTVLEQND